MNKFVIADVVYSVPQEDVDKLTKFLTETWEPGIPKGVPSNLKSLSFTIMLAEWAKDHWESYKVGV